MEIVKGTEKCPPEIAADLKDQVTITVTFDKWQVQNDQAFEKIIITLKKELSRKIRCFELVSEVQNHLESCYQGKGQYTMAYLFVDIFKGYFVNTISMEKQFNNISEKVHRLKDLGYDLKDAIIAMLIVVSLPESYTSLRQHLYIKDKNTLIIDFVIKQILLEENTCRDISHVALIGNGKRKKSIYQSFQDFSSDCSFI